MAQMMTGAPVGAGGAGFGAGNSLASQQKVERITRILRNVPLLQKLTDQEHARIASLLEEKTYSCNQTIIKQGQQSDGFFIIYKGEVVVTRRNKDDEKDVELGRLGTGDYFGEAGLLSNAPRGATVTATTTVDTFYLEKKKFDSTFSKDKLNVHFAKRMAVSAEKTTTPQSVPKIPKDAVKTKTPAQQDLIMKAIQDNVLFMPLKDEHKRNVVAEMYRHAFKKGTDAIRQGDLGDNLYVVESGEFAVFVNQKKVATRGKGTLFGELALLYNAPRAATVRTKEARALACCSCGYGLCAPLLVGCGVEMPVIVVNVYAS